MAKVDKKAKPARTSKAKENQLISLAVDLAEQKLRDGTASSQIICTLLNLATEKHKLEREKIKQDISLSKAKEKSMDDSKSVMDLYAKALDAFKLYRGVKDDENVEED